MESRFGKIPFDIQLILSLIIGMLIASGALLGGLLWKLVSQKIGKATYQVYLEEPETKFQKLFKIAYYQTASL